ncbi:hypothetical protein ACIBH1_14045 [Nonomuraea sp. NPDC050663]|uniref:hypothetical protein n=1 Tax=Nonomuraea sp. NPDC050663 TaxID=3364370 RepID=UPI0037B08B00
MTGEIARLMLITDDSCGLRVRRREQIAFDEPVGVAGVRFEVGVEQEPLSSRSVGIVSQ